MIKVWLEPAPPNILTTTGGWIPVAINVPLQNKTAVCVWAIKHNAELYSKKEYQQFSPHLPNSMTASFEVVTVTLKEIVQTAKLTGHDYVAPEPAYGNTGPMLGDHWLAEEILWRFEDRFK